MARAAEVRRKQRVGLECRVAGELDFDEQHVAVVARRHAQHQLEARVMVHDLPGRHSPVCKLEVVLPHPLDLDPEPGAIADDEAKIPDLRNVDPRVVDLVDYAAPNREPQACRTERAADHLLVAAAPGGSEPGTARSGAHPRPAAAARRRTGARRCCQIRTPPTKALRLSPRRAWGGSFFSRRQLPPPSTT